MVLSNNKADGKDLQGIHQKPKYWTHSEFDLIMLLALTILWWGISMSLQHFMAHRRIVVEIPQSGPTPWKNRPTN